MAKMNLNGMSIEDIRGLNTRTLSDEELKAAANRLNSAANKRVRRMMADEYGRNNPAFEKLEVKDGKAFSTKGLKTRAQIKAEFDRVRSFLDPSKTSHTVKGWRKIVTKMKKKGVTEEQLTSHEFWSMFRYFYNQYVPNTYDSETLLQMVQAGDARGIDNYDDMKAWLDGEYERDQEEEEYFEDLDGEFDDYF